MSPVSEQEYKDHKIRCSESFDSLGVKMDRMELAMYGNKELGIKGVLDMTREMHEAFTGSGFTFKAVLKMLSLMALIGTVLTFLYKLLTFKL